MNITVDTKLPRKGIAGGVRNAGDHFRLMETRYLTPLQIGQATEIARDIYSALCQELPQLRERRPMDLPAFWRMVHIKVRAFDTVKPDLDMFDWASWLIACAIPHGDVLYAWGRQGPVWLVESRPDCHEVHIHSRRLLDDGNSVCVSKSTTPAAVKRMQAELSTGGQKAPA